MKPLKENPISTLLGLFFIGFAVFLLFRETLYDIPLYAVMGIAVSGICLLFAKDKAINILTLGFSVLIEKLFGKHGK